LFCYFGIVQQIHRQHPRENRFTTKRIQNSFDVLNLWRKGILINQLYNYIKLFKNLWLGGSNQSKILFQMLKLDIYSKKNTSIITHKYGRNSCNCWECARKSIGAAERIGKKPRPRCKRNVINWRGEQNQRSIKNSRWEWFLVISSWIDRNRRDRIGRQREDYFSWCNTIILNTTLRGYISA